MEAEMELPLTEDRESREQRLQRLLSGELRNVIRQASHATFTADAHQRASEIARRNAEAEKP